MEMDMKTFNIEELRSWNPCYDPIKYLPEDFNGTTLDIINNKKIPFEDRLWVVLRNDLISDKLMRLFAVWSYRQTLLFIKNPDPISIEAANVAEKYANGEITEQELSAAASAAWSAATSATWSAWSAAESATWSAKSDVESAWSAAWSAKSAAESAQEIKLREMILAGIETGDTK
jgi:hypothetical protein